MKISETRAREIIRDVIIQNRQICEQSEDTCKREGFSWIDWDCADSPGLSDRDKDIISAMQSALIASGEKYSKWVSDGVQPISPQENGDAAVMVSQWKEWVEAIYTPLYERIGNEAGLPSPDDVFADWSFSGAARTLGYTSGNVSSNEAANVALGEWKSFIMRLGDPKPDSAISENYFEAQANAFMKEIEESIDHDDPCIFAKRLKDEIDDLIVGETKRPLISQAREVENLLDGFTTDNDFIVIGQIIRGVIKSDDTSGLWKTRAFLSLYGIITKGPIEDAWEAALDIATLLLLGTMAAGRAAGGAVLRSAGVTFKGIFSSGISAGARGGKLGKSIMQLSKAGGGQAVYTFRRLALGSPSVSPAFGPSGSPISVGGRIIKTLLLTAGMYGESKGVDFLNEKLLKLKECDYDETGNIFLGMISGNSAKILSDNIEAQYDPSSGVDSPEGKALQGSIIHILSKIGSGEITRRMDAERAWLSYLQTQQTDVYDIDSLWESIGTYNPGLFSGGLQAGQTAIGAIQAVGGALAGGEALRKNPTGIEEYKVHQLRKSISKIIEALTVRDVQAGDIPREESEPEDVETEEEIAPDPTASDRQPGQASTASGVDSSRDEQFEPVRRLERGTAYLDHTDANEGIAWFWLNDGSIVMARDYWQPELRGVRMKTLHPTYIHTSRRDDDWQEIAEKFQHSMESRSLEKNHGVLDNFLDSIQDQLIDSDDLGLLPVESMQYNELYQTSDGDMRWLVRPDDMIINLVLSHIGSEWTGVKYPKTDDNDTYRGVLAALVSDLRARRLTKIHGAEDVIANIDSYTTIGAPKVADDAEVQPEEASDGTPDTVEDEQPTEEQDPEQFVSPSSSSYARRAAIQGPDGESQRISRGGRLRAWKIADRERQTFDFGPGIGDRVVEKISISGPPESWQPGWQSRSFRNKIITVNVKGAIAKWKIGRNHTLRSEIETLIRQNPDKFEAQ